MPDWLSTTRIGPLTGAADQSPPPLQDTTRWGVNGVDEGVIVDFDGRTYIYFGDVRPNSLSNTDVQFNRDLIAWTTDPLVQTQGGHVAQGWMFYLPNSNQQPGPAKTEQADWYFCDKCYSLFFGKNASDAGRCVYDNGLHRAVGYEFYIPNFEEGATAAMGQPDWHFCGNCNGMCYAPNFVPTGGCPGTSPPGGNHAPVGWTFALPNNTQGASAATGQADWRYCGYCRSLFFDGYIHKGACPSAPGGGLRLTPVLKSGTNELGEFYGFEGSPPVGATKSDERPGGAFVWNGRVYVFAGVSAPKYSGQTRPGNPQFGNYLLSTSTPDQATPLTTHYLVSPRIGKCRLDDGTALSHAPLGEYFYVSLSVIGASSSWRRCKWCEGLYELVPGDPGVCFGSPEGHEPYSDNFEVYQGSLDNSDHQSNWRRCAHCLMLVYNGYPSKQRCPYNGGSHDLAQSPPYSISFSSDAEADDERSDGKWRYCAQCQCLVFTLFDDLTISGWTPYVTTAANHPDLPEPPTADGVTFSGQAAVMISHRYGWNERFNPGFVLACWHLPLNTGPRLEDLLYFEPKGGIPTVPREGIWTPDSSALSPTNLFDYVCKDDPNCAGGYTETSLLWLPGPRLWMMTYTKAHPPKDIPDCSSRPIYARFAGHITDLGSAVDVPIFDPSTRPADGSLLVGPTSYSYGLFPLERYTTWDSRTGILDLFHLLSLFDPYQVQIMRTQIRLP
jgi:hypothetical protein